MRRWRRRAGRGAGRGKMGRTKVWSIWEGRGEGRSSASRSGEEQCRHDIRMRRESRGHLGKSLFIVVLLSISQRHLFLYAAATVN